MEKKKSSGWKTFWKIMLFLLIFIIGIVIGYIIGVWDTINYIRTESGLEQLCELMVA